MFAAKVWQKVLQSLIEGHGFGFTPSSVESDMGRGSQNW
jgi:hypothetical protein